MREIPKCPKHKTYLAKREPTAECPACHKQFALTQAAAEKIQRKMLSVLTKSENSPFTYWANDEEKVTLPLLDGGSSTKLAVLVDKLKALYTR